MDWKRTEKEKEKHFELESESEQDISCQIRSPPIKRVASGYNMFTSKLLSTCEKFNVPCYRYCTSVFHAINIAP